MASVVEFRIHDNVNTRTVQRAIGPLLADTKQKVKTGRTVELLCGKQLDDLRSRLIRYGVFAP